MMIPATLRYLITEIPQAANRFKIVMCDRLTPLFQYARQNLVALPRKDLAAIGVITAICSFTAMIEIIVLPFVLTIGSLVLVVVYEQHRCKQVDPVFWGQINQLHIDLMATNTDLEFMGWKEKRIRLFDTLLDNESESRHWREELLNLKRMLDPCKTIQRKDQIATHLTGLMRKIDPIRVPDYEDL